jgi:NAD-dependent dihydropyrimidine dehydrogenase PreA subunit
MIIEGRAKEFFLADNVTISKFRSASTYGPHKWPGNRLRFFISNEVQHEAAKIRNAMSNFQRQIGNCVVFEEIRQPGGDYVHIMNGGDGACYSMVGRIGGKQDLSLGRGCTNVDSTIQHEFMHALGFYHEQSRPDRDNHIFIDFDRTEEDYCSQYMKCQACVTVTPYNVFSIMHYDSYGFGCNGQASMFTKSRQLIPYNEVVQQTDIANVKWLYGC